MPCYVIGPPHQAALLSRRLRPLDLVDLHLPINELVHVRYQLHARDAGERGENSIGEFDADDCFDEAGCRG